MNPILIKPLSLPNCYKVYYRDKGVSVTLILTWKQVYEMIITREVPPNAKS